MKILSLIYKKGWGGGGGRKIACVGVWRWVWGGGGVGLGWLGGPKSPAGANFFETNQGVTIS